MAGPQARQGTIPGLIARNTQEPYTYNRPGASSKATHGIGTAVMSACPHCGGDIRSIHR